VNAEGALYLLGLRLAGRRVLVVGGGQVAARQVPALVAAGADVMLVAPIVTTAIQGLAAVGRIEWVERGFASGDLGGVWLACAYTDDPQVNAAVVAAAEKAMIWCVRSDDAATSPAWTPATGQTGEVRVGVLSGDPRRSADIRDDVLNGLRSGAIGASRGGRRRGWVALVGGGPGDPGLITVRGRQLLAEADVVVADRLAPLALLDELRPDVEIIDAAKIPRGRAMAQEEINALLIERARTGRFVLRLKGGDPFVFGRGGEEALACLRAGVPILVVPGVTSVVAAPEAAGIPITHRGITSEFHVVSAHAPPGDPRSTVNWAALGASTGTLVLLMGMEHLGEVAAELISQGRDPGTPVAVVCDGTLPSQTTITAKLGTVGHAVTKTGVRSAAVVVIGEVATVGSQIAELAEAAGTIAAQAMGGDPVPPSLQGPSDTRGEFVPGGLLGSLETVSIIPRERVRELKRRVRELKAENAFLKKPAAYVCPER
jgi:uroporphyrin-III C-methyltransferase / precorrin-2 dehydrogenase / sirohydrochlorin ferrochelatase